MLGCRAIIDVGAVVIAVIVGALFARFNKLQESLVIIAAGAVGLALRATVLRGG